MSRSSENFFLYKTRIVGHLTMIARQDPELISLLEVVQTDAAGLERVTLKVRKDGRTYQEGH